MSKKKSQDPFAHCRRNLITERFVQCLDYVLVNRLRNAQFDKDIADVLGIVSATISRYRSAKQDVTIEHIAMLCDYYGTSEAFIMRGIGKPADTANPNRMDDLENRVAALEKKLK